MPDSGAGVTFVGVVVVLLLLLVLVAWYQHSKSQEEKNKSHQNLAAQKQMKGDALRRGRRFPCDNRWRPAFSGIFTPGPLKGWVIRPKLFVPRSHNLLHYAGSLVRNGVKFSRSPGLALLKWHQHRTSGCARCLIAAVD